MALPEKTIALTGNPNVGKSTVFNALTGLHQHTGNWPGKTVAVARGKRQSEKFLFEIVDLPGTYSLNPHSAEEEVVRDFLEKEQMDGVVVVCDATCLERNLLLVLQVLQHCPRVLVCVNLLDEARKKGVDVNLTKLEELLGTPVVGTEARQKKGLEELLERLERLVEEKDEQRAEEKAAFGGCGELCGTSCSHCLTQRAEEICRQAVQLQQRDYQKKDRRADRWLTGRYSAYPVMLLLLALIFWITIMGANYPSALLSRLFGWGEEKLLALFTALAAPDWLTGVLVEGMYRVLTWVVAVMLPPMAIFFPLFTLLEDVGYLPRMAYNLDYPFQKCRACGKQALTMAMGLGCNAVGVMGCRIIDSPRERLIAILTNSFVPCNGRFPTLLTITTLFLLAGGSASSSLGAAVCLTGFMVLGVGMTFLVSRLLSATLLQGVPSSFVLELPPYRRPQIGKVLVRSLLDRTIFVLGRAVVVAAPAGLLIWGMANCRLENGTLLQMVADGLQPLGELMGLDGVILLAFILGLPANEIVIPIILMTYLAQGGLVEMDNINAMKTLLVENGWTGVTALCTCLFSLFHWPCATTLLTIRKEAGGWRWVLLAIALPTACGMVLCMGVNLVAGLIG